MVRTNSAGFVVYNPYSPVGAKPDKEFVSKPVSVVELGSDGHPNGVVHSKFITTMVEKPLMAVDQSLDADTFNLKFMLDNNVPLSPVDGFTISKEAPEQVYKIADSLSRIPVKQRSPSVPSPAPVVTSPISDDNNNA